VLHWLKSRSLPLARCKACECESRPASLTSLLSSLQFPHKCRVLPPPDTRRAAVRLARSPCFSRIAVMHSIGGTSDVEKG